MDELIKIETNQEGKQTVNARDLHAFLEVGKDFSSWIKVQIDRARLLDGRDFTVVSTHPKGGAAGNRGFTIDYHLTIEAGKHIAMMSGTEKGFDVRDYFLECERRATAPIDSPALQVSRGLLAAVSIIEEQKKQIADMAPKVEFYDAVTGSADAIDLGAAAKVLNMGIGRTKMFEFLRNQGILMGDNKPYQKHIDAGHFRVIEQKYNKPDGSTHIYLKTVVYQKGLDLIRRRLTANGGA